MPAAIRKFSLLILVANLGLVQSAQAIVLFPGDAGVPAGSRPDDAVIGKVGPSVVAIAPNYIITVRHQGGSVGTTVTFGGLDYKIASETDISDPLIGNADLRVERITKPDGSPANLSTYVSIHTAFDQATNLQIVMGGFGNARGAARTVGGGLGYLWDTSTDLHWGTNVLEPLPANGLVANSSPYSSYVLQSNWDNTTSSSISPHEAAIASGDSGGGWFVMNSTTHQWELTALSAYSQNFGYTDYLPPDPFYGIWLAPYASQIAAAVPEPSSLVLAGLGLIGLVAAARRRRQG